MEVDGSGWRWVELGEGGWRWVLGLAIPILNVLINFSKSYSKKGFLVAHAIKMIFNLFCFITELLKNSFSLLATMNRIKKVSKQELQIILCFEKKDLSSSVQPTSNPTFNSQNPKGLNLLLLYI